MTPIISKSVYATLYSLILRQRSPEVKLLGEELSKALIVEDDELKKNIVSINSIVEFMDESTPKPIRMQVVLPEEMD